MGWLDWIGLDFDVGSWKVGRLVRFMCKNKILTGWMVGWMAGWLDGCGLRLGLIIW